MLQGWLNNLKTSKNIENIEEDGDKLKKGVRVVIIEIFDRLYINRYFDEFDIFA